MAKPTKEQLDALRDSGTLAPNSVFNGITYEVSATPTERKAVVETGKIQDEPKKKGDSSK